MSKSQEKSLRFGPRLRQGPRRPGRGAMENFPSLVAKSCFGVRQLLAAKEEEFAPITAASEAR